MLERSGEVGGEELQEYYKRCHALSDALERVATSGLYSKLSKSISRVPKIGVNTDGNSRSAKASGVVPAPAPAVKFQPISLSEATKAALNKDRDIQDTLTDELAEMAAALKANTLAVETKVQERGDLLKATETSLDTSVAGAKASVTGVEAARKTSKMNLCFTLLVFLIVSVGFAAMYIFIRVTSITGYTGTSQEL